MDEARRVMPKPKRGQCSHCGGRGMPRAKAKRLRAHSDGGEEGT